MLHGRINMMVITILVQKGNMEGMLIGMIRIVIILIMAEMGTASMATHKHLCDRLAVSGRRSARLLLFTSSIHA